MNNVNYKHGDARRCGKHPIYTAWDNMLRRCKNNKHPQFHYYGGRGITVWKGWEMYDDFKKWCIENGWKKGLSLDRCDNSKGYSPSNCRWVTHKIQMSNTSKNIFIEIDGKRETIAEWSRITGLGYKTIQCRIKYGWSHRDAIQTPVLSRRECGLRAHEKAI